MPDTQVVRVEHRATLGGRLTAHVDGRRRPQEAKSRAGLEPIIRVAGDMVAAARAIKAGWAERKARQGRGPKPSPVVEFVFAGMPPWDDPNAWPVERVMAFAREAVAWVERHAGPRSVIAAAYLHTDERSPHLHVLVVPVGENGRLGWKQIERSFGLDPRATGSAIFRSMQDCFHKEIGTGFGLGRGEVGSTARHQPINRSRGLLERTLSGVDFTTKQKLEAATLDAEDARKERDREIENRKRAEADHDLAVQERDEAEAARAEAVDALAQTAARAAAAEAERDGLKKTLLERLRERDAARKARDEARTALHEERQASQAELASWQKQLKATKAQLAKMSRLWVAAHRDVLNLRRMQPPTQAAVDQARARAQAAERQRDEANAGWDAAAEACERAERDESKARSALSEVKAKRGADIEDARKTGHADGRASRDGEIAAANRRAADARTQAADTRKDLERLSEGLPAALETARTDGLEAGRAECAGEINEVAAEVNRLADQLTEESIAREKLAADLKATKEQLKLVKATRDELWREKTAEPKTPPVDRPTSVRDDWQPGELTQDIPHL